VTAVDDLVLQLKGLVLVCELRQSRGADEGELQLYGNEIARVRAELARLVRSAA
jgi:hypothetical protein